MAISNVSPAAILFLVAAMLAKSSSTLCPVARSNCGTTSVSAPLAAGLENTLTSVALTATASRLAPRNPQPSKGRESECVMIATPFKPKEADPDLADPSVDGALKLIKGGFVEEF